MSALTLAIIGTVVAVIATLATAWQGFILRKQLETDTRVRQASFHQDIARLLIELDKTFLEHPELRPYFYDGQIPQDPVAKQQATSMAEYLVDLAECYVTAEEICPELTGDWDDYFNYLYRNSHTLHEYWAEFGHLFSPRVARAIVGPSARPKQRPSQQKDEIMGGGQERDQATPSSAQ